MSKVLQYLYVIKNNYIYLINFSSYVQSGSGSGNLNKLKILKVF
jgi:hypothetical protein